jgi:uncharacterized protein with PQ loop repeat
MLNFILWAVYGLKINEFPLYLTNIFGLIFFLFYFNSALWIKRQTWQILPYDIFFFALAYSLLQLVSVNIVGFTAFIFASLWMLTGLTKMRKALAEKDEKFINMPVILTSVGGNLCWVLYGSLLKDFFVIFPNALGLLIYFLNVLVYIWVINFLGENNLVILLMKHAFIVKVPQKEQTGKEEKLASNIEMMNTSESESQVKNEENKESKLQNEVVSPVSQNDVNLKELFNPNQLDKTESKINNETSDVSVSKEKFINII